MIVLGDKVTDSYNGFKGTAVARIEYLNGCVQYEVESSLLDKENEQVKRWIDIQRLEKKSKVKVGGGNRSHPKNRGY
ncbi:hypothetical protein LCGC14_2654360 [marine sediment metagenome]|uniref:Uncharacterized protein n=1 Tax=marine sediment metagenome TaxID=412755 RepID=A0A0F8ZTW3_9ZZZZ